MESRGPRGPDNEADKEEGYRTEHTKRTNASTVENGGREADDLARRQGIHGWPRIVRD